MILITLLLVISWLCSEVFMLIPLKLLNSLNPFSALTLGIALLAFFWCFGE